MAQNWNIDPMTKDYVMIGGAPEETDSLTVPAYFRLKITAGQWLYAPDPRTYGSRFSSIKKRPTGSDATLIESTAKAALQPIIDDGRAVGTVIKTTFSNRHAVGISVEIEKQQGVIDQLEIPSIGI